MLQEKIITCQDPSSFDKVCVQNGAMNKELQRLSGVESALVEAEKHLKQAEIEAQRGEVAQSDANFEARRYKEADASLQKSLLRLQEAEATQQGLKEEVLKLRPSLEAAAREVAELKEGKARMQARIDVVELEGSELLELRQWKATAEGKLKVHL